MIAQIRELLAAVPFLPFTVVTSSGKQYIIPSSEHAGLNPRGTRLLVWLDDDRHIDISALHIVAIERDAPLPSQVD